jgi:ribonuclease G
VYDALLLENETRTKPCRLHWYDKELPLRAVYECQKHLDEALSKYVWLKGGGSLVVEPTEALTVIDVNTGKSIRDNKSKEEHVTKTNLIAASEIARQLRLRNLSGIIVVDFIDMAKPEHKDMVMRRLEEELAKDSVKTTLVDMTQLGLVEITRHKIKKPLHEQYQKSN